MTDPCQIQFDAIDLDALAGTAGRLAVIVPPGGALDQGARRVNRLTKGAVARLCESDRFERLGAGEATVLAFSPGVAAEAVIVVKLDKTAKALAARGAGAAIARAAEGADVTVLAGAHKEAAEIAAGFALAAYAFTDHKSDTSGPAPVPASARVMVTQPETVAAQANVMAAVAEGVFYARDLVNAPANVLTTESFAASLAAMGELGLEVEIMDEAELAERGFRLLLGVGQGSVSPSKVVVMKWSGGAADTPPLALVGKGVVFDTGGISIKPAQGMEEMTMDMGGAGTVAGVMRALALRRAKANVVGIVGLVENMPDGNAIRPGDVLKSLKGDTVEVINTDAEGRLVLADLLWHVQEVYSPSAIVDLATLTGAIIVGLGHEKAGVFASDDALAEAFLKAAEAEGEGAWRMPLGEAYDKMLKSDIADMKNVGGRAAGSVTAAQFLQRFVKNGTPWMHLDIAGVARTPKTGPVAPKGATGWGVLALNRMIADRYEG